MAHRRSRAAPKCPGPPVLLSSCWKWSGSMVAFLKRRHFVPNPVQSNYCNRRPVKRRRPLFIHTGYDEVEDVSQANQTFTLSIDATKSPQLANAFVIFSALSVPLNFAGSIGARLPDKFAVNYPNDTPPPKCKGPISFYDNTGQLSGQTVPTINFTSSVLTEPDTIAHEFGMHADENASSFRPWGRSTEPLSRKTFDTKPTAGCKSPSPPGIARSMVPLPSCRVRQAGEGSNGPCPSPGGRGERRAVDLENP